MGIIAQNIGVNETKNNTIGFVGAFLSILSIFFIVPLLGKTFYTHLFLHGSFVCLILSTIYTINTQKNILIIAPVFLALFVYFDILSFYSHSLAYMLIAYGCSSVFTLLAIVVLMRKILQATVVNAGLIFGALIVYLLSGILWTNFYFIETISSPGSFNGVGILNFEDTTSIQIYEQQFNLLYYSFATLATLGMGDITPLSPLAKSLTAMEAMFGQLFVAVIIAKLVSVWWQVPTQE